LSDVYGIQPWMMRDLSAVEYALIAGDLEKKQAG
jgi:hypothetical protein